MQQGPEIGHRVMLKPYPDWDGTVVDVTDCEKTPVVVYWRGPIKVVSNHHPSELRKAA